MRTVLRRPDFRLLFGGSAGQHGRRVDPAARTRHLGQGPDRLRRAGRGTIFAVIAPMTLAPLVGWVVDRYPRRPFFVAANLVTALLLTPLFTVRDAGRRLAHLPGRRPLRALVHHARRGAQRAHPAAGAGRAAGRRERRAADRTPGAAAGRAAGRRRRSTPRSAGGLLAGIGDGRLRRRPPWWSPRCPMPAARRRRPCGCGGRPSWAPGCGTWPASRRCAGRCSATGSARW